LALSQPFQVRVQLLEDFPLPLQDRSEHVVQQTAKRNDQTTEAAEFGTAKLFESEIAHSLLLSASFLSGQAR
jgi:hypothetical protein